MESEIADVTLGIAERIETLTIVGVLALAVIILGIVLYRISGRERACLDDKVSTAHEIGKMKESHANTVADIRVEMAEVKSTFDATIATHKNHNDALLDKMTKLLSDQVKDL